MSGPTGPVARPGADAIPRELKVAYRRPSLHRELHLGVPEPLRAPRQGCRHLVGSAGGRSRLEGRAAVSASRCACPGCRRSTAREKVPARARLAQCSALSFSSSLGWRAAASDMVRAGRGRPEAARDWSARERACQALCVARELRVRVRSPCPRVHIWAVPRVS